MKKFVVIFLITKDFKEVLMIKRNKNPYKNCWNGIGGKVPVTMIGTGERDCDIIDLR